MEFHSFKSKCLQLHVHKKRERVSLPTVEEEEYLLYTSSAGQARDHLYCSSTFYQQLVISGGKAVRQILYWE